MPQIEIYTQPWCPYCARAIRLLTDKQVGFREIDAPQGTAERQESIRRSGGRTTVPQIFVGGKHIRRFRRIAGAGAGRQAGCATPGAVMRTLRLARLYCWHCASGSARMLRNCRMAPRQVKR